MATKKVLKKIIKNNVEYELGGGIESSNSTYEDMVHLSQAEYEALETKDPNTFYSTPDDDSGGGGGNSIIGEIKLYSGATIPEGFLLCDGSSLSSLDYADLFNVIGYTYGGSDGTFNLPNLSGKVPVGYDSNDSDFSLGNSGGEKTHTLITDEIPSHSHTIDGKKQAGSASLNNSVAVGVVASSTPLGKVTIDNTGGGGAHNNLQPYLTIKYIIKY